MVTITRPCRYHHRPGSRIDGNLDVFDNRAADRQTGRLPNHLLRSDSSRRHHLYQRYLNHQPSSSYANGCGQYQGLRRDCHRRATPQIAGLKLTTTVTGLTETYDNRNVGTGKTLSVATYTVNNGNGGANYTVTPVTNSNGVITAAPLTISAVTNTKVYDSYVSATAAPTSSGLKGSDSVTKPLGDLRHPTRGDWQDAVSCDLYGGRWQQRPQLCRDHGNELHRCHYGCATDDHRRHQFQSLRFHRERCGDPTTSGLKRATDWVTNATETSTTRGMPGRERPCRSRPIPWSMATMASTTPSATVTNSTGVITAAR